MQFKQLNLNLTKSRLYLFNQRNHTELYLDGVKDLDVESDATYIFSVFSSSLLLKYAISAVVICSYYFIR